MQGVLAISGLVLLIIAVLLFLFNVIAIPAGLTLTVIYFFTKDKETRKKLSFWIKISLLGIAGLIIIGMIWALHVVVAGSTILPPGSEIPPF